MKRWIRCSSNDDVRKREKIAEDPSTRPEVLAELANDEGEFVRWAVAKNPSTRPEVLAELANDKEKYVRRAVAKNPSTSPKVLEKLANDKDKFVRWEVAENPSTSPKVLEKLANDEVKFIRDVVRDNPNAPSYLADSQPKRKSEGKEAQLRKLFEDHDICPIAMEHINDADYTWEYDTPEAFSNACLDWIYDNLDDVSEMCETEITEEDLSKITDWILDECSQGDFDI